MQDCFIYKTRIDLKDDITYWTKTKDSLIVICFKNKISFYEIKNNYFLKTQNDLIIKEETFIENSPYFKTNKEMKEKIKEKESNSKNLLILKIFELENDYIIIIKKEFYEDNNVKRTSECPQCSYYICKQTNFILLSIIKLQKKERKIKNIYEFEIKNEIENEYDYEEYYGIAEKRKEKKNHLNYFNDNIINTIEIMGNKVLFYNPELENIQIIDINSSFEQKYKSILYNPEPNIERYKIMFLSENCFYIFKYIYDEFSEFVYKKLTFINKNKKTNYSNYDIVLLKKIKSLWFIFDENTLTIVKKNNLE